ncbi:hypothetical protein PTSG_11743 [Salpingoeca rosetta]|uniref:Uncharacterized protein n=1 Tax=Salpingoeca rosetta (strain ATCC 50818 / BSB-021) TaxID=946362 RepID=F2U0G8_SALR5|nr:uncharacterized protein PTSG_11743 [Salpingoeca rosetta]EGD80896.1 hypothetical protein PTSG_11743 [Salpingoeca rosetta]|eukprot:XP_004997457.1 hypothetical protein PTSG_11743 [Salpingoeca rosetta]
MAKHKKKEKKHKKKTKHHHRHRHSSSDDGSDRRSSSGSSSSSSDSDAPEERLAEDDYYRKNAEFRHWLKHKKHKTLDDYSYDKRRKYFKKFVKYWNHGRLSQKYYDGGFAPGTGSSSGEYKWKVMDELVPRETGRDARISKRKGANEARRARAVSPDPDDATLMGNDQFKAYMQRRKYQQERER